MKLDFQFFRGARHLVWMPVTLLAACGLTDTGEDPCQPNGHIHRSSSGDWCHCERGYVAQSDGMSCVPDPNYNPSEEFKFGDEGRSACWRLENTQAVVVPASEPGAPTVNRFNTVYRIEMQPSEAQYTRKLTYQAAETGDFIFHLSAQVPLEIQEEGRGTVDILAQKENTACEGFSWMAGTQLAGGLRYTLTLGPTSQPEVVLLVEQLVP